MNDEQGLYLITEGGYSGRLGYFFPKCPCRECDSARKSGYLRLRLMDMTSTLVTEDECDFVCTGEKATEIVQRFSEGASISELPEGAESLIRETLSYQSMIINSFSFDEMFDFEVVDGLEVPPEMMN